MRKVRVTFVRTDELRPGDVVEYFPTHDAKRHVLATFLGSTSELFTSKHDYRVTMLVVYANGTSRLEKCALAAEDQWRCRVRMQEEP